MKIAVNTRFLIKNTLEGIGWFTYESLKRIVHAHPDDEFLFYFDRPYSNDFVFAENVNPIIVSPPARHPFLWYYWFEYAIRSRLKQHAPDVFLSTDGHASLRTDIKTVLVVHDIAFEHYPEDLPPLARRYYLRYTPKFIEKAIRIATVSHYSKEDIVKTYGVDPDKVDVVFNGANALFQPITDEKKTTIKERVTGGADYFVYTGALHPRKNVLNLLKAFEDFKSHDDKGIKLVLAGRPAWRTAEMESYYYKMEHKDDVKFTGHLHLKEIHHLLASSLALTYVSYFEGFGIPIIEAFNCEVPVITSNVTSMPEVANGGALLVDPFSTQDITKAMLQISTDASLRDSLIKNGRIHCQKFSWDKTAKLLWQTIEKAMEK